jgi:3,4-dihydroxy 2-butanone 4-phosphate synthase/GTP cyclohydrolase II
VPLTESRCKNWDYVMVSNTDPMETAFTVSVDLRGGVTTGISAADRAKTILSLANGH